MPPTESFITNLLAMRSHYQAHIQQGDRVIAHAQDGLSHVNALLVDEVLDNQHFALTLLQMRSHLQAVVDEQQRRSATAKEQVVHINVLLAEQMAMQHRDEQIISMQAKAYTDNPALTESIEGKELPTATEQLETTPAAQEQVKPVEETDEQKPNSEPDQISSTVIPPSDPLEEMASDRLELLPVSKVESAPNNVSKAEQTKTPLLPHYQRLTKFEAVEKLLQENIGSILHVNYIIRSLYGELDTQALKVERQRLYETLSKGVARGLWDKVPDQPGCYTIDLKLVDREAKSIKPTSQQKNKADTNGTIELLPAYQHLNFTQAVETVLKENAGQVMNSDEITRILYGNLEAGSFTKTKEKIGKILWAGARQKRWQVLPGKQGSYTMAPVSIKQG